MGFATYQQLCSFNTFTLFKIKTKKLPDTLCHLSNENKALRQKMKTTYNTGHMFYYEQIIYSSNLRFIFQTRFFTVCDEGRNIPVLQGMQPHM